LTETFSSPSGFSLKAKRFRRRWYSERKEETKKYVDMEFVIFFKEKMESERSLQPDEDRETFSLRNKYTQLLLDNLKKRPLSQLKLTQEMASTLGFILVKKVRYGVTYDERTEKLINQINQIFKEITRE
jgi:hypothetical protein